MKYFNYFKKKLERSVNSIHSITPKQIIFTNGLTLHYDFEEDVKTTNARYKDDIHNIIKGIVSEVDKEIDSRYLNIVKNLKNELEGFCANVECIVEDETDNAKLVFLFHTGHEFRVNILKEKLLKLHYSAEEFDKFVNSIKTVDLSVLVKK